MQRKENGMGGVLAAIIAGAFMPGCDTTIVAIGVPALMEAFSVGASQIQWVSTVYLLALAVGVPVAGWTEHTRGGRFGWMAGMWLFLAGSVLCAVSPTLPLLVCSSAVLGFAAGMIITLMTSRLRTGAASWRWAASCRPSCCRCRAVRSSVRSWAASS